MAAVTSVVGQSVRQGLTEAVSAETKRWAVVFDFDADSCYPAPVISPDGKINAGRDLSGGVTEGCRQAPQLWQANTYCRSATIEKGGNLFSVYMYALYFEKDQIAPHTRLGHRHDWEFALVWTTDNELTHASFSAHGKVITKAKRELYFDENKPEAVKVVYHKDGFLTHAFRPATADETPQNESGRWVTPTLIEWDRMQSEAVSNEQMRRALNTYDFGSANCSFNDKRFRNEIAKNPPPGYPEGSAWKRIPLTPVPPHDRVEPEGP